MPRKTPLDRVRAICMALPYIAMAVSKAASTAQAASPLRSARLNLVHA